MADKKKKPTKTEQIAKKKKRNTSSKDMKQVAGKGMAHRAAKKVEAYKKRLSEI